MFPHLRGCHISGLFVLFSTLASLPLLCHHRALNFLKRHLWPQLGNPNPIGGQARRTEARALGHNLKAPSHLSACHRFVNFRKSQNFTTSCKLKGFVWVIVEVISTTAVIHPKIVYVPGLLQASWDTGFFGPLVPLPDLYMEDGHKRWSLRQSGNLQCLLEFFFFQLAV
jgi:hypothetical protein